MFYIIQENLFKEVNYKNLITSLNRLDLKYEIVKVRPFIDDIEFNTTESDVFVFGAIKMSLLAKKYDWTPGSMHNENHDYEVYKNYYKENLLNYDSEICTFNSKIDFKKRKFIRPTLDTKTFTGRVFDFYEWKSFINSVSKSGVDMNIKLQVSSVKQLYNENRFWIVGGKIVTYSTYRIGGRQLQSHSLVETEAIEFVKKMIKKFQLAEAFVMDVAKTKNGYKIVECGCINCAGFYDSDLQELIIKLENHFEE